MIVSRNQLESGEEVIVALQDHWVLLIIPFLVYVAGWGLFFFLFYLVIAIKAANSNLGFILLFLDFTFLFIAHHFLFLFFIQYFLSPLIVTNKRLIKIRFLPFFQDDVTYIELAQINEIDKKKHGFWENLLNCGDVSINPNNVVFRYVRYPSKFINIIECLKSQKPLSSGDLKGMGANCPPKYRYLLK